MCGISLSIFFTTYFIKIFTFLIPLAFMFTGFPDQGYEDSDNSSVFSADTPSPKQPNAPQPSIIQMETQHASLRRKKLPKEKPEAITRQTTLEKSQSLQAELASQRPLSMVLASQSEANVIINPATGSLLRQVGVFIRYSIQSLHEPS